MCAKLWWKSFGRSSFPSHVILTWVSFFFFLGHTFFEFGPVFRSHVSSMEKKKFSTCRILCWMFWRKKSLKKLNSRRGSTGPKNSYCGHQQPFNIFLVLANFRKLPNIPEKNFRRIVNRKISCNRGKYFWPLSQEKHFLEVIEKNRCFVIYNVW